MLIITEKNSWQVTGFTGEPSNSIPYVPMCPSLVLFQQLLTEVKAQGLLHQDRSLVPKQRWKIRVMIDSFADHV